MMNPFPMATGPDPLLAARIPNFPGLHPMLALQAAHAQHQAAAGAISPASLAAHYLQNKAGGPGLGGIFAGYNVMLHPPTAGPLRPGFLTSAAPTMSSAAESLAAARLFANDPAAHESVDMRKSSIDALRLKAREHSATMEHRITTSEASEIKS